MQRSDYSIINTRSSCESNLTHDPIEDGASMCGLPPVMENSVGVCIVSVSCHLQ